MKALANKTVGLFVALAALSGCVAVKDFLAPLGSKFEPDEEIAVQTPIEDMPRLEPIARNYFQLESPEQDVIGEVQLVFASEENTFSDLAREYGLGYDELVAANPDVDPWLPGAQTPVVLPTQFVIPDVPREGIVLNIASKRLFYFQPATEGAAQTVLTYPIGIGRVGWETPIGSSTIIAKARDPSWYVPASVRREHEELGDPLPSIVPPGPDNPLGKFVLKLDIPGYLLHGTNQPYGVGMRVSHGCVRLYPENIEILYELVGMGESVRIVNEPYLAGQMDGQWYVEGHAPLEDDEVSSEDHLLAILAAMNPSDEKYAMPVDDALVRSIVGDGLGIPIKLEAGASTKLMANARVIRNTVVPDPNMPSLEEVRALLDEPLEDEVAEEAVNDK